MICRLAVIVASLCGGVHLLADEPTATATLPASPETVPAAPASEAAVIYQTREVEGWTVHLHPLLVESGEQAELGRQVLELLQAKLIEVRRLVPAAAVRYLRQVPFWVEYDNSPAGRGCCYHPSAAWLRDHGFNPAKARGIEICIARNFLDWSDDQPAAVLHELAHAWHHQVLGFEEPRVKGLWDAVVARGDYQKVLHISGRRQRHYALQNHKEYFAEMTEAYFWTNDFFPFVRAELREADPAMFELLGEVWKLDPPAPAAPRGVKPE